MSDFPEKITMQGNISFNPNQSPNPTKSIGYRAAEQEYIRADLVPQWQPIETMPEGMEVLLRHFDEDNYVGQIKIMSGRKFIDTYGAISVISNFTHWMPIPKVPE